MNMEVEAFIFGKKIGTILLKDGIVYFEYDKEFQGSNLEISPITSNNSISLCLPFISCTLQKLFLSDTIADNCIRFPSSSVAPTEHSMLLSIVYAIIDPLVHSI